MWRIALLVLSIPIINLVFQDSFPIHPLSLLIKCVELISVEKANFAKTYKKIAIIPLFTKSKENRE
jgi:hypothetical protein